MMDTAQGRSAILGYRVTTWSIEECLDAILDCLDPRGSPRFLVCANPHSLEVARTDPAFDEAIRGADLLIPDGTGIVIASRILGGRIRGRITGMDVFLGLNRRLDGRGGASCFFLGSSERTLARIAAKMAAEFPGVRVAGTYAPPYREEFSEDEESVMVDRVNAARPDVLWVGMTAPKQEKWIHRNRRRLEARFIGAVGAVFDYYAGTVKRAHPFFAEHGLEWLPRLLREPRRLWRRNLVSSPRFLARVVGARLMGGAAR